MDSPGLCTIGYEGRTLENYLNRLIRDGVTQLCDVRRNAFAPGNCLRVNLNG